MVWVETLKGPRGTFWPLSEKALPPSIPFVPSTTQENADSADLCRFLACLRTPLLGDEPIVGGDDVDEEIAEGEVFAFVVGDDPDV